MQARENKTCKPHCPGDVPQVSLLTMEGADNAVVLYTMQDVCVPAEWQPQTTPVPAASLTPPRWQVLVGAVLDRLRQPLQAVDTELPLALTRWQSDFQSVCRIMTSSDGSRIAVMLDAGVGVLELDTGAAPVLSSRRASVSGAAAAGLSRAPSRRLSTSNSPRLTATRGPRLSARGVGAVAAAAATGAGAAVPTAGVPRIAAMVARSEEWVPLPLAGALCHRSWCWSQDGALIAVSMPMDGPTGSHDRVVILDEVSNWAVVGLLTPADFGVHYATDVPVRVVGMEFRSAVVPGSGGSGHGKATMVTELVVCWSDCTVRRLHVDVVGDPTLTEVRMCVHVRAYVLN